jgi:hypothetical protein
MDFAENCSITGRWVRAYKHLLGHLEGLGKEMTGILAGIGEFNL